MNIQSNLELSIAKKMEQLIELGASAKDLITLFPQQFSDNPLSAKNKSQRIYKDLCPATLKSKPGRSVLFHNLAKSKKHKKLISNFSKYLSVYLDSVNKNVDLTDVFIKTYKAWLSTNNTDEMNFQQAYAIFRHIVAAKSNPYDREIFKKCTSCSTHYLSLKMIVKKDGCPYCS